MADHQSSWIVSMEVIQIGLGLGFGSKWKKKSKSHWTCLGPFSLLQEGSSSYAQSYAGRALSVRDGDCKPCLLRLGWPVSAELCTPGSPLEVDSATWSSQNERCRDAVTLNPSQDRE